MSTTRKTIEYSQIEVLRECLMAHESVTVYFQGDASCAEYLAEIVRRNDSRFDYMLGGHGIGSNKRQPVSLESTVERVMLDNGRFNAGGSFTVEFV